MILRYEGDFWTLSMRRAMNSALIALGLIDEFRTELQLVDFVV